MAITLAAPYAEAEAEPQLVTLHSPNSYSIHFGAQAPVSTTVNVPGNPQLMIPFATSNCEIQYDVLETQICAPRTEKICEIKDIISQSIKSKKVCKNIVTDKCNPVNASVEGASDHPHPNGQRKNKPGYPNYGSVTLRPDPSTTVPAKPFAYRQIPPLICTKVVSEYCLNSPTVEEITVPINLCYAVNKVECVKKVKEIPKNVCTPYKYNNIIGK